MALVCVTVCACVCELYKSKTKPLDSDQKNGINSVVNNADTLTHVVAFMWGLSRKRRAELWVNSRGVSSLKDPCIIHSSWYGWMTFYINQQIVLMCATLYYSCFFFYNCLLILCKHAVTKGLSCFHKHVVDGLSLEMFKSKPHCYLHFRVLDLIDIPGPWGQKSLISVLITIFFGKYTL